MSVDSVIFILARQNKISTRMKRQKNTFLKNKYLKKSSVNTDHTFVDWMKKTTLNVAQNLQMIFHLYLKDLISIPNFIVWISAQYFCIRSFAKFCMYILFVKCLQRLFIFSMMLPSKPKKWATWTARKTLGDFRSSGTVSRSNSTYGTCCVAHVCKNLVIIRII